MNEVIYLQRH